MSIIYQGRASTSRSCGSTIRRPMHSGHAVRVAFQDRLDGLERGDAVRALVLTGTGRSFCSGDDLKEQEAARKPKARPDIWASSARLLDRIEAFRVPVIAAINGWCLGRRAGAGTVLRHPHCIDRCDVHLRRRECRPYGISLSFAAADRCSARQADAADRFTARCSDASGEIRTGDGGACAGRVDGMRPTNWRWRNAIASRAPLSVEATKRFVGQRGAGSDTRRSFARLRGQGELECVLAAKRRPCRSAVGFCSKAGAEVPTEVTTICPQAWACRRIKRNSWSQCRIVTRSPRTPNVHLDRFLALIILAISAALGGCATTDRSENQQRPIRACEPGNVLGEPLHVDKYVAVPVAEVYVHVIPEAGAARDLQCAAQSWRTGDVGQRHLARFAGPSAADLLSLRRELDAWPRRLVRHRGTGGRAGTL